MLAAQKVVKNTTFLLGGRILSVCLGVIYVAFLARYIHASGMGEIATATSLVSILALLVTFGFGNLIVRDVAREKANAGVYLTNVFLLRLFLSVLFFIIVYIVTTITKYNRETIIIIYIYGLAFVLDALTDVVFSIFNAFERMGYQATIQTGRDILNFGLSLGAIYFHLGLIMIVFISAVACLVKLIVSIAVLRWQFVKPSLQFDFHLCLRLIQAALPFAILVVFNSVNFQIITVYLSLHHTAAEVGWFSTALTLVNYLLLIPNMFLLAIFPVFSKYHASSEIALQQAYRISFKFLLLLGFALCIGTIVTADKVINLIYGPGYKPAVLVLQIIAFNLFCIVGFANGALLNSTGYQTFFTVISGIGLALSIGTAYLFIPRFSIIGASIASIIGPLIFFIPLSMVCHRQLGLKLPWFLTIKVLIASICMGAAVSLFLKVQINLFITIFAIAPFIYALLLLAFHAIGHEDLLLLNQIFRKKRDLVGVDESSIIKQ
jgi:O-antigen/teichoic acid export membrane protein